MAKKILNLDTVTGAKSWGSVDADNVVLDTTNFDKNLDTTITDVQKLADAVDELELGGGGSLPTGTIFQTLRYNSNATLEATSIFLLYDAWNRTVFAQLRLDDTEAETCTLRIDRNPQYNISEAFLFLESNTYGSNILIKASKYNPHISMNYDNNEFVHIEQGMSFINCNNMSFSCLAGENNAIVMADSTGSLYRSAGYIPNRLEFLSDPLTVASDGYAFSNTQLGLTGINLNDKIKMIQCYVIQADYPNIKNNELIMGHNIEDGQISVRTNFNLAVGDRIKIYIEYID